MNENNNLRKTKVEATDKRELDLRGTMEYSVRYVRWLSRILGIWPLVSPNSSKSEKTLGKITRPIAVLYSVLVLPPMFAEVIAQRAPREELISLVAPLAYQAFNVMKHFFMLLRIDIMRTSLQHMETDWQNIDNDGDRAIMVESIETANKLAIIITISMYIGGTLHNFILPALDDSYINELNETIRPLCFPGGDFFLNVQAPVVYEIVFVTYWMSDMFVVTVSMTLFTLALILLRHTCGQIEILNMNLGRLVDANKNAELPMENSIAPIVRHHARLLVFAAHIEQILKEVCAMEVLCDLLILCFLGYVCIMDISNYDLTTIFTYVMLLATIAFNLYLYCQIGEVLKEKSHLISHHYTRRHCCNNTSLVDESDRSNEILFQNETRKLIYLTLRCGTVHACTVGDTNEVVVRLAKLRSEEYQSVGTAAYMIDWYKLPTRASLDLIMIINMSAEPRRLTAGGMMELSRTSYVSIMKTAFAYLNMLRTMA